MKCCIYERSRLQAVESAIRDDISFEMDARLYEIVVECITSDLHYDIPEFAVVEPYGVVDPLRVSHGWRFCTNEQSFELGWTPGGFGWAVRAVDGGGSVFLTYSNSCYALCSKSGDKDAHSMLECAFAVPDLPEQWILDAMRGL